MAKVSFESGNVYTFYLIFFLGCFWGFFSYFALAYLYFTLPRPLFWFPAFTLFLPTTIPLLTQPSENIGETMLLSALNWVLIVYMGYILYKLYPKKAINKRTPKRKKRI